MARFAAVARLVVLTALDRHWRAHLTALHELRAGIGLRAYGGEEPLAAYGREAAASWRTFRAACCDEVAARLLSVDLAPGAEAAMLTGT
jgi:preprotein translocase subunit SecA